MGICIHMSISNSVTKEEWEKVYEETLQLVNAFPFAERLKANCNGIDMICLVKTEERAKESGWNYGEIGWCADGDYETMRTAEEYFLPKDFIQGDKVDPDAGDALLGVISCMDYDWCDDKWCDEIASHHYHLWGNKTQGEPYHIYLLAIACMIESRLGEKVVVYGDITRGQCRRAVELANQYLAEPIDIPDRCDMEKLWKRICGLPFCEWQRLSAFKSFYLGTKGREFGNYIRKVYSATACEEYWRHRLKNSQIGTIGFSDAIQEYLLWGFDLQRLCGLVNFDLKDDAHSKKDLYIKFVKSIMDAKLHQKEKDCSDVLKIDQEESEPYSIYTLIAQFAFAGERNLKVDRYIPMDEIRKALKSELGTMCDVDAIIDEYLENERCESETFQQIMDTTRQVLTEKREKYAIFEHRDLIYYEAGDTVYPAMEEVLGKSYLFYMSLLKEDGYNELMQHSAKTRCKWLVDNNKSILMRDKDWEKIFIDIENNENAFARYYPMVRVICDTDNLICLVRAFVLNDKLYEYAKEVSKNFE